MAVEYLNSQEITFSQEATPKTLAGLARRRAKRLREEFDQTTLPTVDRSAMPTSIRALRQQMLAMRDTSPDSNGEVKWSKTVSREWQTLPSVAGQRGP